MALQGGYRVTKLMRCWHWRDKDWSKDLFRPYIRLFMRLKYHGNFYFSLMKKIISCNLASGWPSECLDETVSEEEREQQKQRVIDDARRETGIDLDPTQMIFNPGLRYVAKLCLNSLWVLNTFFKGFFYFLF